MTHISWIIWKFSKSLKSFLPLTKFIWWDIFEEIIFLSDSIPSLSSSLSDILIGYRLSCISLGPGTAVVDRPRGHKNFFIFKIRMSHSWVFESNHRIFEMTHLDWEWALGFKNQFFGHWYNFTLFLINFLINLTDGRPRPDGSIWPVFELPVNQVVVLITSYQYRSVVIFCEIIVMT